MKGGLLWHVVGHSINAYNLCVFYFEGPFQSKQGSFGFQVYWNEKIYRNWGDCFLEAWIPRDPITFWEGDWIRREYEEKEEN